MNNTMNQKQWPFIRNTLGPLVLMLTTPTLAILIWYVNTHLNGSLTALWELMRHDGFWLTLFQIWEPIVWGSQTAWFMIGVFIVFQLALMRFLPGKAYQGSVTPKGNRPVYKANGIPAFIITMLAFCLGSFYFNFFPAAIVYDHFGALLGALNLLSLMICFILYFKGIYAPSSTDASTTGHFLFDYYWGTELYPQFFGVPVKMFIACRLGMMSWGVILISYCAKQHELSGLSSALIISVALQLIYTTKFFMWETGYLSSLDMMYDRAGFYICWGCLVWVPCVYTSPAMYLVAHPTHLNSWIAAAIFILGSTSILINYLADRQRQRVRLTEGQCKIWGKAPITAIAHYQTEQGEVKQNLLLASGWWGITRHFHYIPEILSAFFWSLPALFTHFIPYFYVTFLTILLIDRAYRDEARCAQKYGQDWDKYCQRVPYKIIPYLI